MMHGFRTESLVQVFLATTQTIGGMAAPLGILPRQFPKFLRQLLIIAAEEPLNLLHHLIGITRPGHANRPFQSLF